MSLFGVLAKAAIMELPAPCVQLTWPYDLSLAMMLSTVESWQQVEAGALGTLTDPYLKVFTNRNTVVLWVMVKEETPDPSPVFDVSEWRDIVKKLLALFLVLLLSLSLVGCGKKKEEIEEPSLEDQIEDTITDEVDDEADEWDESGEPDESPGFELDLEDTAEEEEEHEFGLSAE